MFEIIRKLIERKSFAGMESVARKLLIYNACEQISDEEYEVLIAMAKQSYGE